MVSQRNQISNAHTMQNVLLTLRLQCPCFVTIEIATFQKKYYPVAELQDQKGTIRTVRNAGKIR